MLPEIHQTAIRMLARREHSFFELKQKLLQRNFSIELIEQVLEKLMGQGLLSDERYTECYIRSRMSKGCGPTRIAMELREHGISKDLIAQYLKKSETDWQEKLKKIYHKKFGPTPATNQLERAKQIRYLLYKGFSLEQINKIVFECFDLNSQIKPDSYS